MPDERTPRDDAQDLIDRQQREITHLRDELARAEQRRREVERERDRLKRQNERLKQQLDAARRAGFRQAAPFAKDRPQGRGGRPGRRAGAARSPWAPAVQQVLLDGLALRDRRDTHEISAHGLAVARGRLVARVADLIDTAPELPAAQRFAAHFAAEFPAIFAFLWEPGIDATHSRAEQAIPPTVVARKVCGGNRTQRGADTQEVLTSVVRTIRQRCLDLTTIFTTMLRAPHPAVPDPLQDRPR